MATTVTPNVLARSLTSSLKRTITAKAVRTVARDVLARFDKSRHPAYQGHEYTASEVTALRKAFAARGSRAKAQPVRRKARAKVTTPRKVTTPAPVAS
jgi:hypothetical protein